jgi:branched-chain amino acid transport system substrate-binding protein
MTGSLAEAGDEVKRGAELAAGDINATGGVNGRRVVLSIEDDACHPKQAVSVANHVVGEQIALVDGHVCSGASIPASAVYAEYGVLMMTPASVNSKLTDNAFAKGWPTIMRLYARDDNQCQAPSWNENMKCFLDLAINSENIGRPCSRY